MTKSERRYKKNDSCSDQSTTTYKTYKSNKKSSKSKSPIKDYESTYRSKNLAGSKRVVVPPRKHSPVTITIEKSKLTMDKKPNTSW